MKFFVDARLPPLLAAVLREGGLDALAVREVGLRESKDAAIWQYALEHDAAIITKDEDFAQRSIASDNPPIVIWLRIGNATNPRLLRWLLPLWPAVLRHLEAGERFVEVR